MLIDDVVEQLKYKMNTLPHEASRSAPPMKDKRACKPFFLVLLLLVMLYFNFEMQILQDTPIYIDIHSCMFIIYILYLYRYTHTYTYMYLSMCLFISGDESRPWLRSRTSSSKRATSWARS